MKKSASHSQNYLQLFEDKDDAKVYDVAWLLLKTLSPSLSQDL